MAENSTGKRDLPGILRTIGLILAIVTVLSLLLGSITIFPRLLVESDLGSRPASELDAAELIDARNKVRATLLQGLGAAFFLATAFFTWRQIQLGQNQLRINQEQVKVSEDDQLAGRFTRAIDQLGSDKVDVRLGGIYALERIARDSLPDRESVIEILSTYVRHRSPIHASSASEAGAPRVSWVRAAWRSLFGQAPQADVPRANEPAADIQAIMTVLGRRERAADDKRLNLCRVDLRNVDLRGGKFQRVRLVGSRLEGADLRDVHLDEAAIEGAFLQGAKLRNAQLPGASLVHAHLERANLYNANLRGAKLIDAHLAGARLSHAQFDEKTNFLRATYDDKTFWPNGIPPGARKL